MAGCKYSKYCGGCVGIENNIDIELKEKSNHIRKLFVNYKDATITDCYGDYYPYKYRNKIHLAFTQLKGKTLIGFFEESSCRVVDVDSCQLFGDWATKLISVLREFVSRFKIMPYDGESGVIRYAHARCIDNRLQLTLVVSTDNFAGRSWLQHELSKHFVELSLYININRRTDRAIFDKNFKFVGGSKYLKLNMCGVNVSISPSSFLQVNLSIAEKMYKDALTMLEINKNSVVVDLYSGIGITSILFSKHAKNVIAIEEVLSATENAKFMCGLNGVKNVKLLTGKCENLMHEINPHDDMVVFVDPARVGLDSKVIEAILNLNPRKIVYMSCNPSSCVLDIDKLTNGKKYSVTDIKPYNMFPYTKHIEVLVCLKRNV